MKQSSVLPPVIDLKRGGSIDERQIIDTPPHAAAGLKVRTTNLSHSMKKFILSGNMILSGIWCYDAAAQRPPQSAHTTCTYLLQDTVPSGFSSSDALIPLADEYDPMFPNDYEKVVKRHREERQRQREQERQKEIDDREK